MGKDYRRRMKGSGTVQSPKGLILLPVTTYASPLNTLKVTSILLRVEFLYYEQCTEEQQPPTLIIYHNYMAIIF